MSLFTEESNKFLHLLSLYTKNETSLKSVMDQCVRMNLLFYKDHPEVKGMRAKVYEWMRKFSEKLKNIEDLVENEQLDCQFKEPPQDVKETAAHNLHTENDPNNKKNKLTVKIKNKSQKCALKQNHDTKDGEADNLIFKAAYLGLSQNIPANRAGGLPPFPQIGMITKIEKEEEVAKEAFEF